MRISVSTIASVSEGACASCNLSWPMRATVVLGLIVALGEFVGVRPCVRVCERASERVSE